MKKPLFLLLSLCGVAHAGPPILTDDPDTPERGHWEINIAATAEKRSDVWSLETPLVDLNYGLLDNVQLKLEAPFLVEAEEGGRSHSGMGDAELGVKWRFLDQEDCGLSVSAYPQFGFDVSSHATNSGLAEDGWEALLPFQVQREIDEETTVFAELGYVWNEHGGNGLMWGLAAEREISETFALLVEIHGESESKFRDAELVANLGFHWQATGPAALIGSIGRGLTEGDEAVAKVLGYLGVQFTF